MNNRRNADLSELEEIFDSLSQSYQRYWEAYVMFQNQLYETLRAARIRTFHRQSVHNMPSSHAQAPMIWVP